MSIRVQTEDFDMAAEYRALSDAQTGQTSGHTSGHTTGQVPGAVVTFTGLVRDLYQDKTITAMTLEHYPGMTEKELTRIYEEAMARWPISKATIIHRVGRLEAGEQIVFVGCASAHREAAFEACHFIMDFLKTDAPFWKAEESEAGINWVDARDSDRSALKKWQK